MTTTISRLILLIAVALGAPMSAAADYGLALVAIEPGDVATAHREFSVLAEQGHREARYSLAMLYLKNDPSEYARATPWLEKSSRQGLPHAQYVLGTLTIYGVGVARNPKQGRRWVELARLQGSEDAEALLTKLDNAKSRTVEGKPREKARVRDLQAEPEKTKDPQRALQEELAQSKSRERLEAELVAPRSKVAEIERSRQVVGKRMPEKTLPDEPPGELVVSGRIMEVLSEGVLLTEVSKQRKGRREFVPEEQVVFVNLLATHGLSDGQHIPFIVEPTAAYHYKYNNGGTGSVRAYCAIDTWLSN